MHTCLMVYSEVSIGYMHAQAYIYRELVVKANIIVNLEEYCTTCSSQLKGAKS